MINKTCLILLTLLPSILFAQKKDSVSLEIVNLKGKNTVLTFKWPFTGTPYASDTAAFMMKVDDLLIENGVDCPPKREKISDHMWRCGNGKIIRTDNVKFSRVLELAWDNKSNKISWQKTPNLSPVTRPSKTS